jgi:hypothetical protein
VTANAASPASSGPAGSHFEGQVGAYYLLSMLTGSEPRGLPGTTIDHIELQRAAEGRPLDDIIVHAHDSRGDTAVLEIQVKRSITFAPSDPVFSGVVGQIVQASRRADFWISRYELAIATARTSRKINGAYQDVLTWARQIGDAATFMDRIARPGSANADMRTFVNTFKNHLRDAGSPNDDETVWRLLRKMQILVFDFTATGSVSEELVKERAIQALHPDDKLRAGNLWTTLVELALQVAASGGDRNRIRLIDDLRRQSFRLAGERRFASARAALAEASRNALADIYNRVGDVILTRHDLVVAVHAALDNGRYIEIRGDAGVGKSGVLKHFAEQIATESQVIVLTPGRTIGKGWAVMRAMLGFDGSAHDLLTDIACDGGAILFIDGIDFFTDEERMTVVDLVRHAPDAPGLAVVATMRSNFGVEEPNWLPSDALDRLGRTDHIMIGELSESEVEEIRHAAPRLAPLLADTHPARDVTRNLFRLDRLANWPGSEPFPRTEVDMAVQWWRTADGRLDDVDHRERARLLRTLAEQALAGVDSLDVRDRPARAIDALVISETLRNLRNDRVSFRHDVFREWAIANLLHSEKAMIDRLPLDRPAPALLARGIELYARLLLEREADSTNWQSFVERLSRNGIHGSWRRAALLALVRSEIGTELLKGASGLLLADRASMLRELIRIVMAVDVQPASQVYAAAGIDPTMIPAGINVPSGPSWYRLIRWLLSLGQALPAAAIPDVADLYTAWSRGTLGSDPLTPLLLQWLYSWLIEIETSRDVDNFRDLRQPFGGEISHDQIKSLEDNLRMGFLLFCNRAPELAVEYLQSVSQRRHKDNVVRSILKFSGTLAQAAPAELAELTAAALIPRRQNDEQGYRRLFEEPFDYFDHEFIPASPAQGPFFELLTHAPQHGLSLIHRLVDHAISFYSQGCEYGADAFIISFPDGERVFPWCRSYWWSREGYGPYNITSALMALEAWAHLRIEKGEPVEQVLADALGPPGSPAAYLLVAVDLLLSHWPKSLEAAVPFLACPELLCTDRMRQVYDNFQYPDIFGFRALQKEPVGTVSLESLKNRPSRQHILEELINHYAIYGPVELRETLTALLHQAAARLGPPDNQSNLGDPALMAVHALNLVDPGNWRKVPVEMANGTQGTAYQYVAPEEESRHFTSLQEASKDKLADTNMQAAISLALEDPSRSSHEFAAAAVEWAQKAMTVPNGENVDDNRMREQSIISAAMIAMRDGDSDLRARHSEWAHRIFAQAMQTKEDPGHRIRSGIRFNPFAIAFVGMSYALKDRSATGDVRALLEAAAHQPSTAHGFGAVAVMLASIDERLPRAILRCALTSCIRPRRVWGLHEKKRDEWEARLERHRHQVQAAIDEELAWLADERPEPDWPAFPPETVRPRRRGRRLPGGQWQEDIYVAQRLSQAEYADYQAAAIWLRNARGMVDIIQRPWIKEIVRTYAPWTTTANGAGLEANEEVDHSPREWNEAYFELMAYCLPGLELKEIEQLTIKLICSLPDEPFFDVVTQFLQSLDVVYFNDLGIQEPIAISIRSTLANRLMASRSWKWLAEDRSKSIGWNIGPAIAVFFFNNYNLFQPAKCYLLPKAIDRLDPFLPILEKLVENGPSLFIALLTLNLLEVSPRSTHLLFLIKAAKTWIESYPDDIEFWNDYGIGRRVCLLIEVIWRQEPTLLGANEAIRFEVDRLLSALISLGVAEARRLEEALNREPGSDKGDSLWR